MSATDHFSQDTTGLPESRATEIVDVAPGGSFELRHRGGQRSASATRRCACSPTTARSRARRCAWRRARRSRSTSSTRAISRRRCTGTACASTTAPTARTRRRRRFPIGGRYSCTVAFPDPGLYWYHPHIREDYGQEMGLYGNVIVEPADPDYWAPVNREWVLTLDDVLIEDGRIAAVQPFGDLVRRDGALRQRAARRRRARARARGAAGRGGAPVSHQHRQHARLQGQAARGAHEARRRRQRPLRARGDRRGGDPGAVGARDPRRALRARRRACARAPHAREGLPARVDRGRRRAG